MEEKRKPEHTGIDEKGKAGDTGQDAARGEPSLLPEGNVIPDENHRPEKPPRTSAA